jgi:hypothetical protein
MTPCSCGSNPSARPAAPTPARWLRRWSKTTIGRVVFLPKTDTFFHGTKIGEGYITGLMVQWQNGNPVTICPANVATGKMNFPPSLNCCSKV